LPFQLLNAGVAGLELGRVGEREGGMEGEREDE
jgi:hypothetical protein